MFDQFLTTIGAANLGVSKVSLEEAFATGFVVSNHLADVPETEGLLQKQHFARMRDGAVFINTGGAVPSARTTFATCWRPARTSPRSST